MQPIDSAHQNFRTFLEQCTEGYWQSIRSESDVRMKIIDPIFKEILGWPLVNINCESPIGDGFIDYRLTVNNLNRLIVEAKKDSIDLGVDKTVGGRSYKLNGPLFQKKLIKEGVNQAIRYCGHKNAELACVTNGRQWIIFRGNRLGDGIDTIEGQAFVFGSLELIESNFKNFYDLLSYDSVCKFVFRGIFQTAEDQPMRLRNFREPATAYEDRRFQTRSQLSNDIERIMASFFRELSERDDPEARKACFVVTEESNNAETTLLRIAEILQSRVQSVGTDAGTEIAEIIRRVKDVNKPEITLLVGSKGAGKSTFIDRFFEDILPKHIGDDCLVIRVDLSQSGSDSSNILPWLTFKTLELTEKALYAGNPPTFEEIQGAFFGEYKRLSTGPHKYLYDNNKSEFKTKFGDYVEDMRKNHPSTYLLTMLKRAAVGHKKIPCLVFDNADHYDVMFQEEIFKFSVSIYKEVLSLILVPITDTTSWSIARNGAIQSFFSETLVLPSPPTEAVLRKRIEFIEKKISEDAPEKGRGYFSSKGIRLDIDNIKAFASCLQTVFINTGSVAEWVGRLSNYDIRGSLKLARAVISSPYLRVDDILRAFVARNAVSIDSETIKLSIVRGKYDIYSPGEDSFVQNIFALVPEVDSSPLMGVRILQLLSHAYEGNKDNDGRYVTASSVLKYFAMLGIDSAICQLWLEKLHATSLILSYNPTVKNLQSHDKIQISPAGFQHLSWALEDLVYLEAMAETTPLMSQETCQSIRQRIAEDSPQSRRDKIRLFLNYLIEEDGSYLKIPEHSSYKNQEKIHGRIKLLLGTLNNLAKLEISARFARNVGYVQTWFSDRRYGFIKPCNGEPEIFVHLSDILEANTSSIPVGTKVEYDVGSNATGPTAVQVVIIETFVGEFTEAV